MLGKLDLQHALLGVGVLSEDVEDQSNTIHDVALKCLLEVPLLGRAQVVVEHDNVDVLDLGERHEFPQFPAPDERCCNRPFAPDEDRFHRL